MKTVSRVVLAFAFVLVACSIAGHHDSSLPGIGVFAYNGSSMAASMPQSIVIAIR